MIAIKVILTFIISMLFFWMLFSAICWASTNYTFKASMAFEGVMTSTLFLGVTFSVAIACGVERDLKKKSPQ